jgi:accessory colonization factor AcfC
MKCLIALILLLAITCSTRAAELHVYGSGGPAPAIKAAAAAFERFGWSKHDIAASTVRNML